jgi:hypothetical protein
VGAATHGEMSEGAKVKAWLCERIEELSERRAGEVAKIWHAPAEGELPTHYSDGGPIPEWVFAVREVMLQRGSAQ